VLQDERRRDFQDSKVEYGLLTSPDEPEPLELYDDRREAETARMVFGGGVVVCRAIYQTDWVITR
jgi:hypothetical protein